MVGVVLVALTACDDGPRSAPPTPVVPPAEQVFAATWARSLPLGDPPTHSYVTGNTLHRPDGDVVLRGYADAGMVGDTVAGTVVLGEIERRGVPWGSEFLLVAPDGGISVIADGRFTGAQEAVVSPDGRYLARDRTVVDITDRSVVAQIPDEAEVLIDWTEDGIRYWAGSGQVLWQPGEQPHRIATDREELAELTRSPDDRWSLTSRLGLVDRDTGERRWLAGAPLWPGAPRGPLAAVWEDADHVLFTAGGHLVRCAIPAGDCERTTDLLAQRWNEVAQLSP